MAILFIIFISYLLSAACSEYVYLYPHLTDWESGWTYFWIIMWTWILYKALIIDDL